MEAHDYAKVITGQLPPQNEWTADQVRVWMIAMAAGTLMEAAAGQMAVGQTIGGDLLFAATVWTAERQAEHMAHCRKIANGYLDNATVSDEMLMEIWSRR